jgi:catechol 2,3-dioxygenase-like lactoylglutathione lyase family enzyme
MARAVGLGGVFLKARDPNALAAWYAKHLGVPEGEGGVLAFDGPESFGMTVFSHFPADTRYFGPGGQQAMINFRVDDLDALLVELAAAGVTIDPKREDYPYGSFAWIEDPEGNRVELWQPPASASG